jgi:hypothetical protein
MSQLETRIQEILTRAVAEIVKVFQETPPAMWSMVPPGPAPAVARRETIQSRVAKANGAISLDVAVARVKKFLESHPGQGLTGISTGTGLEKDMVSRATLALLRTGEARRKGEKRGTKYVLI